MSPGLRGPAFWPIRTAVWKREGKNPERDAHPVFISLDTSGCEGPKSACFLLSPATYTHPRFKLAVPRKQVTDLPLSTCNEGNSSKFLSEPALVYCLKCYLTHLNDLSLSVPPTCPHLAPPRGVVAHKGVRLTMRQRGRASWDYRQLTTRSKQEKKWLVAEKRAGGQCGCLATPCWSAASVLSSPLTPGLTAFLTRGVGGLGCLHSVWMEV